VGSSGTDVRNYAVHRLRFGLFEIDLQAGELRKHGLRIKLPRQSFCALSCLLERPGELVTREVLCQRIWSDGAHVQFDQNLNAIMRVVREALGDIAKNPRFIVTEPKLGYRFVAPVSEISERVIETEVLAEPKQAPVPRPGGSKVMPGYLLPAMAAVGVMVIVAGIFFWKFAWPFGQAGFTSAPLVLAQITHLLGDAGHPSFSPDGTILAFDWNGDQRGGYGVYLKRLGSEEVHRLTTNLDDDTNPAWSPSGRDIAFLRRVSKSQTAIVIVPAQGGGEREVARLPRVKSLCWSRDSEWIAYSLAANDNDDNAAPGQGIAAVSLSIGQRIRITSPAARSGDSDPVFSPDDRALAFIRDGSVYVVPLDKKLHPVGIPHRFSFTTEDAWSPVWTPDGRAIIFASGRAGYGKMWRIPYGKEPGSATQISSDYALDTTIDNSGRHLVYSHTTLVDELSLIKLCRSGCTSDEAKRLVYSAQIARNAAYSADGRKIAFECTRSARTEIWACDVTDCNPRQITDLGGPPAGSPTWSPSGEYIAFDAPLEKGSALFVVSAKGGMPRQLTGGTTDDLVPSWSRDGRWLYFASKRTGALEVWKMPSAGGAAIQITRHGGFRAFESFDGKYVYYSKSGNNTSIWKASREGTDGDTEQLVIDDLNVWQNFCLTPKGVYFVPRATGGKISIKFYDFASRTFRNAATIESSSLLGVTASPDGQNLVVSRRESNNRDLMLLNLF
jgi:Tol biopolymer transport system component/DNA-binding winged helix-turn-helix (wHTH) protein